MHPKEFHICQDEELASLSPSELTGRGVQSTASSEDGLFASMRTWR